MYTTSDNHLRWNYTGNNGHVPARMASAVSWFDDLMTEIGSTIPSKHRRGAFGQLGKALFTALDGGQPESIEEAFTGVRRFVRTCAAHSARFRYVLAFLLSAVAMATGCLLLPSFLVSGRSTQVYFYASAAGIAGASMSVLYRSAHLRLDPTAHAGFLALQGLSRSPVGALFGFFIVLACQGELILAFVKDHPLALYPLAIAAGFSERFVAEIMGRLEAAT